jgi:ligand-binding sensor domain-containing protein
MFTRILLTAAVALACAAQAAPDKPVAAPHSAAAVAAAHAKAEGPVRAGHMPGDPTKPFTHFRVGNRNVKSIFLENETLWVGTSGGVVRYDTKGGDFKLLDIQSGLLSNGIFHVSRLRNGKLAVGTYGGGLSLLDEKTNKWETYNIPEGLGDAFVYDVLQMKNGDIWIATWSGANRIRGGDLKDAKKWELHTVESTNGGLINDWVYGLAEGKDGIVWMATEGGLVRWQDGKWDNWNHARGLGADYEIVKNDIAFKNDPSRVSQHHAKQKQEMGLADVDVAYNPNYIIAIAVDKEGIVWVGTWGGGLGRYDGRKWKNYTTKDGLPGNHVSMLHFSKKGELWIGTNNGLSQMKDGKFVKITTDDGLFANTVFSMAASPKGDIWVGSYGGVAHINKPVLR